MRILCVCVCVYVHTCWCVCVRERERERERERGMTDISKLNSQVMVSVPSSACHMTMSLCHDPALYPKHSYITGIYTCTKPVHQYDTVIYSEPQKLHIDIKFQG